MKVFSIGKPVPIPDSTHGESDEYKLIGMKNVQSFFDVLSGQSLISLAGKTTQSFIEINRMRLILA